MFAGGGRKPSMEKKDMTSVWHASKDSVITSS